MAGVGLEAADRDRGIGRLEREKKGEQMEHRCLLGAS
jgi:hypothetical protein